MYVMFYTMSKVLTIKKETMQDIKGRGVGEGKMTRVGKEIRSHKRPGYARG